MQEGKKGMKVKEEGKQVKKIRRYAIVAKGSREERENVEVTRVKEKGKRFKKK